MALDLSSTSSSSRGAPPPDAGEPAHWQQLPQEKRAPELANQSAVVAAPPPRRRRAVRGVGPAAAAVLLLAGLAGARRAIRGRKAKKEEARARGATSQSEVEREAPHATPRPGDPMLPPEGVSDAADKAREQQLRELIAQRRAAAKNHLFPPMSARTRALLSRKRTAFAELVNPLLLRRRTVERKIRDVLAAGPGGLTRRLSRNAALSQKVLFPADGEVVGFCAAVLAAFVLLSFAALGVRRLRWGDLAGGEPAPDCPPTWRALLVRASGLDGLPVPARGGGVRAERGGGACPGNRRRAVAGEALQHRINGVRAVKGHRGPQGQAGRLTRTRMSRRPRRRPRPGSPRCRRPPGRSRGAEAGGIPGPRGGPSSCGWRP